MPTAHKIAVQVVLTPEVIASKINVTGSVKTEHNRIFVKSLFIKCL